MSKLEMTDNLGDVIIKLSEGNPGAMTTLFEIMNHFDNDEMEFLGTFLVIDSMALYGSQLYMLWSDCCNRDIEKTVKVINLYCNGVITDKDIEERIKNVGYGKSFDDLIQKE